MSRCMNQTYFECNEFDVNVVLMLIAICTYKSMSRIDSKYLNFNTVDLLIVTAYL